MAVAGATSSVLSAELVSLAGIVLFAGVVTCPVQLDCCVLLPALGVVVELLELTAVDVALLLTVPVPLTLMDLVSVLDPR